MNKKMLKIVSTLLMVVFIVSFVTINSFALTPDEITAGDVGEGGVKIQEVGQSIVGILQTVGVVVSVVILIVLGLKYMMGSVEEKAEYKKTLMPYVIGAALIFAASIFANVVYQFFININK